MGRCRQAADESGSPSAPELLGRRSECEALDRLLSDALAGQSRVAVLRGEAGVGKSALLGYLSDRVADWHVARAVGIESEMELAYAGLHQLCAPMLDQLGRLSGSAACGLRRAGRSGCPKAHGCSGRQQQQTPAPEARDAAFQHQLMDRLAALTGVKIV